MKLYFIKVRAHAPSVFMRITAATVGVAGAKAATSPAASRPR
jgi:hypothetical protein